MSKRNRLCWLYRSLAMLLCVAGSAQVAATETSKITNKAAGSYFDAAHNATVTLNSNSVDAPLPSWLNYYDDARFVRQSRMARMGGPLFIEASASGCNTNDNVAENVTVNIISKLTGDRESFAATETGPATGVFRINTQVMTANAALHKQVSGNGVLEVRKNDALMSTIAGCSAQIMESMILIDPSGVVFDSKTNAPLAGTVVTLIDVMGDGNGGIPGGPAIVFSQDGVTPSPSTVTTDADGVYEFPLVAPSQYRLKIIPAPSYTFPSKAAPASLSADRNVHLFGSFGADFPVNASTGAVVLDVPLDYDNRGLYVDKAASRTTVEIADFLDYTITVKNLGATTLTDVVLKDTLPTGFAYEPGSVRLNRVKVADPNGGHGPALTFPIGELAENVSALLTYRVRIGAGATLGDGINRAQAASTQPIARTSNIGSAKVKVQEGVFSSKAYIVGKAYLDCDGSLLQEKGEAGIPGVRIYLEDGSYAITDIDGKYSFYDVSPRTHVLKVDATTLPAGAKLAVLSHRNAGDANTRFVDLKNGELHKADFAEASCTADIRREVETRRNTLEAKAKILQPSQGQQGQAAASVQASTQAQPAVAVAELDLHQLDNALEFINLRDRTVLPNTQTKIQIKGVIDSRLELKVNGAVVSEERVGKRSSLKDRQLQVWEYIGVNLKPGENVLELTQQDGFGNPRGNKRIVVIAPDQLARFVLTPVQDNVPADGRSIAKIGVVLEDAHGTPVTGRTQLTLETSAGTWQVDDLDPQLSGVQTFIEGGKAEFNLLAPQNAADAKIRVSNGAIKNETVIHFIPDLRPMIAAGLIEGAINVRHFNGNMLAPARKQDGFEQSLQHFARTLGDTDIGARSAVFLKGKIKGDYLLTLAYDSDKEPDQKLFRDIDPNTFYPVYGDNAIKGFEAQSTSRLFVRVDKNKSWLLYGDFTTSNATVARSLSTYNRSLTGVREHLEKGNVTVDAFASRDSTRQIVDEIAANGTSGPYMLSQSNPIANSEKIEIITRDRNQPGIVIKTVAQARLLDYDLEPLSGRILFRGPIASLDADLNPVSIRVAYEVEQGGKEFWTGGVSTQLKLSDSLTVGGGVVTDRNPQDPMTMQNVNTSIKIGDKTTINAEVAQMKKASIGTGRAERVQVIHAGGKLEVQLSAAKTDVAFDNPSGLLTKGRAEGNVKATYKLDDKTRVIGEVIHTEDVATSAKRDGVQGAVAHTFENSVRVEAGMRQAHETAPTGTTIATPDITSVRTKISTPLPNTPQASVFVEGEQDVRDSERKMLAAGGEYQLSNGGRLYGRHELISSLGSNYALNDNQQRNATVFGIDSDYMKDGRMFSEYRANGGFSEPGAQAAIGLRNLWAVGEGIKLNTSLERVQTLSGDDRNQSVAVTGGIEYTKNPLWKGTARLELRSSESSDGALNTLGLAYKLNDAWTFLGKSTVSVAHNKDASSVRTDALLQAGAAYRALASLGWNGLGKYEYKLERDNGSADIKRAVHIVSAQGNYQPDRETTVTARFAGKMAFEQSLGIQSVTTAQLVNARFTRDLGKRWDVGVIGNILVSDNFRSRQYGAGLEVGYLVQENMWVSVGYNFYGFNDRDLSVENYTGKGLYVRLRYKFDERNLESLLATKTTENANKAEKTEKSERGDKK